MNGKNPKVRQISLKITEKEYEAYSTAAAKTYRTLSGFIQYAATIEADRVNQDAAGKEPRLPSGS